MTLVFWLALLGLSVLTLVGGLIYTLLLRRAARSTHNGVNVTCTALLLALVASAGVYAHWNEGSLPRQVVTEEAMHQTERLEYDEIYRAFQSNELRADEEYGGRRYRLAAEITEIGEVDPLALDGDIHLSVEVPLEEGTATLTCGFSTEYWEELMDYQVGDTIVFEGTCESAFNWDDCMML